MKRIQRINRVSRKRPPRQSKFLPIVLILATGAGVLQLAFVGLLVTAAGAGAVNYYHNTATLGLAKMRRMPSLETTQPTRILDRHGKVLWEISDPNRGLQQSVPLAMIPHYMRQAIISSEDRTFYKNPGFDPNGIGRALLIDVRHRGAYAGGSTITQQIVKQQVLGNQRSVQRKLQEILIAYAVSQPHSGFTKNDILQLYLNTVFFGHQAYGVEAAAKVFFGKDVWKLDVAQCALLAGLVQAPTRYDPLGYYGPTLAMRRAREVLGRMLADHAITPLQYHTAIAEVARFRFTEPRWHITTTESAAPYWTDWIQNLLGYQQSYYTDPRLSAIIDRAGGFAAGLTIKTTLDLDMYRQAQAIMQQRVAEIAYNNVHDAAVVVLDPRSAECLAMVGGIDYFSSATGSKINMAASPRQPGSSFKPFTYVTAFEKGWYPAKMLLDQQRTWPDSSEPGGIYAPQNYDKSWHGAVTVRMALANSLNIPAVETIDAVGVRPVLKTAVDMGVSALRRITHAGLSLTLGSKEVPLWQMAQAYNTFANGGVFRPMASVLSIQDALGHTVYRYQPPPGVQVIAPQYTYLLSSILKDNYARTAAFGVNSQLQLGPDQVLGVNRPAAVKTGTSQNFVDNLTIGYTPNLLTATWVGNPNHSQMNNVEGVTGAGPIWHDLMEWSIQHLNLPYRDFVAPPGVTLQRVSSSGALASSCTAWPITDVFAAGTVPHHYDNCAGPNYTGYRIWGQSFSLDGGNTNSIVGAQGPALPSASARQTPGPVGPTGNTGTGLASGLSGDLAYNPGSRANLCGGGRYTYAPVYVNGQVHWHYQCQ